VEGVEADSDFHNDREHGRSGQLLCSMAGREDTEGALELSIAANRGRALGARNHTNPYLGSLGPACDFGT